MKLNSRRIETVIFLCLAALVVASVTGFTIARRNSKKIQQESKRVTDSLPPVISKVKNLKVIKADIELQETPAANAVLEIMNDSDKAITYVTVTFGSASVGEDGGYFFDEPVTVIEPHGTITIHIPLGNLEKDVPLIVAGAFYADGTEDGEDIILEMMHDFRKKNKAERDAKKKKGAVQ